jgi:hypothetical protein
MKKILPLKALFSPFKPFRLKFYAGKIVIGTPHFFPRKWVKLTKEEAMDKAKTEFRNFEDLRRSNPESKIKARGLEEIYQQNLGYRKAVPKKIGFDIVRLGWKTKWSETDLRFEWAPLVSFVFFKWQIAAIVRAPEQSHYWEAWLYYEIHTDSSLSKKERIAQCRKDFPQTWKLYKNGEEEVIDYYERILRKKYLTE